MRHLLVYFYVSEEMDLNSCRMQNGGQHFMAFSRFFVDCKATIIHFSFIKPALHTVILFFLSVTSQSFLLLSRDPFSKCFLHFQPTGSSGNIMLAMLPRGGNRPWHTSGMWPWLLWLPPAELGSVLSQQLPPASFKAQ